MTLKQVNILHIADLHFDTSSSKNPLEKVKLSSTFKSSLASFDPREIFYDRLHALLGNLEVDVLAFTGDIAWANDPEGMRLGFQYLEKLKDLMSLEESKILISPGNHDLNRKAEKGKEFDLFLSLCVKHKFSVATPSDPVLLEINGIPLIGINTCLGGTENAYHGLPEEFWNTIIESFKKIKGLEESLKDKIPPEFRSQLVDMDVPAIGHAQLNKIDRFISQYPGNCALIFGHHNLLPTHQMIVRPYADLIDSGKFIYNLINQGKRIIFFHGHTHSDSSLCAHSPEDIQNGFIACLGTCGLNQVNSGWLPSASHVKIVTDDSNDFLTAIVTRFISRGTSILRDRTFIIYDNFINSTKIKTSIDDLKNKHTYTFQEVKEILKIEDEDYLAAELIMRTSSRQVTLVDQNKNFKDWRITKNV